MKIAVIGGTGKIGKVLIEELVKNNYDIKMLVRNPLKVPDSNSVEIINGDVLDLQVVRELVNDCEVVISTLGQDLGKKPMFFDAIQNIVRIIEENNVKRYIMVAGIAIETPNDKKNFKIRLTSKLMKFFFSRTIKDKQRAFEFLRKSNLDWTVIRVPVVKMTDDIAKISVNLHDCTGTKVNVNDLVNFMVKQISEDDFIRKSPFVFNSTLRS